MNAQEREAVTGPGICEDNPYCDLPIWWFYTQKAFDPHVGTESAYRVALWALELVDDAGWRSGTWPDATDGAMMVVYRAVRSGEVFVHRIEVFAD